MNIQLSRRRKTTLNAKGQNIIEYLLLVTAVVIVLIAFMNTRSDAPMRNALEHTLNTSVDGIDRLDDELRFTNAAN
jgi:hypothetical protein